MNTKLDIVRFENEDVIATSAFCSKHPTSTHLFVKDGGYYEAYYYISDGDKGAGFYKSSKGTQEGVYTNKGWNYLDEQWTAHVCDGTTHNVDAVLGTYTPQES